MSTIITLLTDFGTSDGYVAEVKGRLLALAPGATLVDIAHDIAPGDLLAAAYVLGRTWRSFPEGTVHLAVADPGVGSERRALAAEGGGHRFVVPDNGLLTFVEDATPLSAFVLPVPGDAAPTFHGRDVLAPAAAALANEAAAETLGEPAGTILRLQLTPARRTTTGAVGTVVHVDRFGTLVTNIPAEMVARGSRALLAGRVVSIRRTFADVQPGEAVAFTGSGGTIEVAVRDGRADEVLGVGRGTDVRVE
jgi:hypothetical protein